MIYINHEIKAIFIHIPKTGGSYIGPTLEKYYGFTNYLPILMQKRPDHDILCRSSCFPKNLTGNFIYDNVFFNKMIGLLKYCKTSDFLNKRMGMDETKWETYTKFCFIRNPYTRVLSGWKHFNEVFNRKITLNDYLNNDYIMNYISDIEYGHVFMSQTIHIEDFHGCGVNIIGRFEYLENDLRTILHHLGFNTFLHPVKRINVSNQDGTENIILEASVIKKINELFYDDFEMFHYHKMMV